MAIQWILTLFTVVAGTGAWLFATAVLSEAAGKDKQPPRIETIIAFIVTVVGGTISVLHLKHPDRIMEVLNHPTSGIFIEAAFIGVMCLIMAVFFVMILRKSSTNARKVVGIVGVVVAVVFTFECGSSYMMEARPAWCNYGLPLAFMGTTAAAGSGLNLLVKALLKRESENVKFAALMACAAAALGLVCAVVFVGLSSANYQVLSGEIIAWLVVLFVCAIAGVAVGYLTYRRPDHAQVIVLAAVVFVVGFLAALAVRCAMWLTGTATVDFFMMPLD